MSRPAPPSEACNLFIPISLSPAISTKCSTIDVKRLSSAPLRTRNARWESRASSRKPFLRYNCRQTVYWRKQSDRTPYPFLLLTAKSGNWRDCRSGKPTLFTFLTETKPCRLAVVAQKRWIVFGRPDRGKRAGNPRLRIRRLQLFYGDPSSNNLVIGIRHRSRRFVC